MTAKGALVRSSPRFRGFGGYLVITGIQANFLVSFLTHPFPRSLPPSWLRTANAPFFTVPAVRPSPHPRASPLCSALLCPLSGMEDFPPLFNTRIGATDGEKIWFCSGSLSPKQIDEASELANERDHLPPYLQSRRLGATILSPFLPLSTPHLTQNMHSWGNISHSANDCFSVNWLN